MTNKEKYKKFCEIEMEIPIFSKHWWLDSVCGENNWDVSLVEKGGEVVASLPYYKIVNKKFVSIKMPKLTQKMGPYIKYPSGQSYYKRLSWEKDIMDKLINNIGNYDYFVQNFNYKIVNWLPFYHRGFSQTTFYTYTITPPQEIADIEQKLLNEPRRRRVKKAKKLGIEVFESDNIEVFYKLNMKTFQRQEEKMSYDFEFVKKLYENCMKNNAVKILFAKYKGDIVASSFLVYDNNCVYYLMGGIEPTKSDLGAMDLVQLEGIKYALANNKVFDFEGSMIESIEKYFRSFGAIQKPYLRLSHINSKLYKIKNLVKEILK